MLSSSSRLNSTVLFLQWTRLAEDVCVDIDPPHRVQNVVMEIVVVPDRRIHNEAYPSFFMLRRRKAEEADDGPGEFELISCTPGDRARIQPEDACGTRSAIASTSSAASISASISLSP